MFRICAIRLNFWGEDCVSISESHDVSDYTCMEEDEGGFHEVGNREHRSS